jgi:hypothetical protein
MNLGKGEKEKKHHMPAVERQGISISNALFKPRADARHPVMSAASRVPRARGKVLAQGTGG